MQFLPPDPLKWIAAAPPSAEMRCNKSKCDSLNATTKTFRQLSAGKAEKNEENRAKCEEKVGEADLVKSELLESFEDDPNFLFSSDT